MGRLTQFRLPSAVYLLLGQTEIQFLHLTLITHLKILIPHRSYTRAYSCVWLR